MEDFDDFEESPLDILDGDGDDALEMCLFFDKDDEARKRKPGNNTGCSFILLAAGSGVLAATWGLVKLVS